MSKIFDYMGIFDEKENIEQIEDKLPEIIKEQHEQYVSNDAYKIKNVSIVDFAFTKANPNKFIVFAKWKNI
jgi:hypothetical protein